VKLLLLILLHISQVETTLSETKSLIFSRKYQKLWLVKQSKSYDHLQFFQFGQFSESGRQLSREIVSIKNAAVIR
jgi:hypothetical protein